MYYKMPKFDIYLLWGKDHEGNILRYYGSTSNFIKRKYNHKIGYKHWVKHGRPNNKKCSAYLILDNGDWKMEKIDEIDGERWEARKLEGEYQKNNDCVNIKKENRTKKEWLEDNRDIILEKKKEYYNDNKQAILEQKKEYRDNNKGKIAELMKEYYNNNKQAILELKKEYYNDNKQAILEQRKEYRDNNKEKLAELKKEYYNNNKQAISEKRKEKYKKNKNEILEKRKEKIICECGAESTKNNISKHRRSKKHINFISNNELNV